MYPSRRFRATALAGCATMLFALAACGTDDGGESDTSADHAVRLYGSDGNMINSFGDEFKDDPGVLEGMKGTQPLTPLSDDFKNRLRSVAPGLQDYVYSAETYDAVVISALAAQQAGTTASSAIAQYINGVTAGGQQCETVEACLTLARAGADLKYRGVSLRRGGFTDAGEPSTASYATLHFGTGNHLDDGKTEFVGAGDESTTTKAKAPAPKKARDADDDSAPLVIGGLLPQTGDLAIAYPPMAAGAALAIRDINAAGGVLGEDVVWIDGDDGTNPDKAKQTVASHIAAGVHVIIGAAASGISRVVLPDVVGAGLVLFSPSNTAAGLSTVDDKGLYFRTAPSDILQGRALADVMLRDGPQKIAIVARNDAYGTGLQGNVRTELERFGVSADQMKLLTYEPPADSDAKLDFTAGAQEIKDFGADAVLVIGFSESAAVIRGLVSVGVELRH